MNMGFRYCKSWEGGLFLTSEMVFTSLFGIFFLHELVTWRFLGGGLLILASNYDVKSLLSSLVVICMNSSCRNHFQRGGIYEKSGKRDRTG
jgi:hypothetical protein